MWVRFPDITTTNVYLQGAFASIYLMLTLLLWVKYHTARMAERSKALVKTTLSEAVGSRPTHGSILLLLNINKNEQIIYFTNDSLQVQV